MHRRGDEAAWWQKAGVDPIAAARALWLETRPIPIGPDNLPAGVRDSAAAVTTDRVKVKSNRRAGSVEKAAT